MRIAGFQKNSFVDYPGKIAAVVFTPGCNLDCYYCHNRYLLTDEALTNFIPQAEVFKYLYDRQGLLDAVVITGGEPTIQPGLEEFILNVRKLGFLIKLDTNGTSPEVIKKLIDKKLLDYIAMDVKAPFMKYAEICGTSEYTDRIRESIKLLIRSKVEYEFRTTLSPRLDEGDILSIAVSIKGAAAFVLQQMRNNSNYAPAGKELMHEKQHSADFIRSTAEKVKEIIGTCYIRGL